MRRGVPHGRFLDCIGTFCDTLRMGAEDRKSERYEDFGRFECPEICMVHGVLEDISKTGCKVHFDAPISISRENDYDIRLRLSHSAQAPLALVCHPQWVKDDGTSADIGFAFLRSPDTARLESYVAMLHTETRPETGDLLPKEEPCQFV